MTDAMIRSELARDIDDIRAINIAAFANHPYSQQTEHLIVDALRADGALTVSLVAVLDDQAVGYIAFSEARIGTTARGWHLAGPVAVLPGFQNRGIGSALVEAGLAELRSRSAEGCILVGDPGFYARFGFRPYDGLVYEGVPDEFVLALPFRGKVPTGEIAAHEAFFRIAPTVSKGDA
jgi:putative acetyltransferase